MNISVLKQVILDQQNVYLPDHIIPRDIYQKVSALADTNQIIVISGIRRCGKSTLMQQIRHNATEKDYYLNFDDDRLVKFQVEDFQHLLELFMELFGQQRTMYFDEIQNIPGWERFIRRLHDQGYKIYITGSNATMFSKELGTRLTGRYIQIELYPFSFHEYVNSINPNLLITNNITTAQKAEIKNLFSTFITIGGIPEFIKNKRSEYLHSLYESIIYRDIIARFSINEKALRELGFYLASNVGKEITYNSLRSILGLASASTVSDYCGHLEDSFLCFFINRYDFSLKKQIHFAKKIYFIDQALARSIGFRTSEDRGRLLENIVFIELKRRYQEIYFHKQKKECDFLIKEGTKITTVIQVSSNINSEKTMQRELDGLAEAMELYGLNEGYIINEEVDTTKKIEITAKNYVVHLIPLWKWLLTS